MGRILAIYSAETSTINDIVNNSIDPFYFMENCQVEGVFSVPIFWLSLTVCSRQLNSINIGI